MNKKSGFPMQNTGFPMNESEKIRESGGKPAAFPIIGFTSGWRGEGVKSFSVRIVAQDRFSSFR
jgi:hypothetical protein